MPVRKTPSNVPAPPMEAIGVPKTLQFIEIEQISPDGGAEASADIGQRCGMPARQQQGHNCRRQGRNEQRQRNSDTRHRIGPDIVAHRGGRTRWREGPRPTTDF